MGKPTICFYRKQRRRSALRYREADQRFCFRYMDSAIPLIPKSEILSFWPLSVHAQAGLCRAWLEPKLFFFSCACSFHICSIVCVRHTCMPRTGVAPLRIETGRYKGLSEVKRTCTFCEDYIEDEIRVIFDCNLYNDIRTKLFQYA